MYHRTFLVYFLASCMSLTTMSLSSNPFLYGKKQRAYILAYSYIGVLTYTFMHNIMHDPVIKPCLNNRIAS